jgi:hypothetical protein
MLESTDHTTNVLYYWGNRLLLARKINMSESEVVQLISRSKSEAEWNDNCDRVKKECGGYPSFWYVAIIMSGLLSRVSASWKAV